MNQPIFFISLFLLLLVLITGVKVFILFKASRRKNLRRWIYYNQFEIVNAPSERARRLRKLQNTLSIILFIFLLFFAVVYYQFIK